MREKFGVMEEENARLRQEVIGSRRDVEVKEQEVREKVMGED